jgi:hypothetical protein
MSGEYPGALFEVALSAAGAPALPAISTPPVHGIDLPVCGGSERSARVRVLLDRVRADL